MSESTIKKLDGLLALVAMIFLVVFVVGLVGQAFQSNAIAYDVTAPPRREPSNGVAKVWTADFNNDGILERITFIEGKIAFELFDEKSDGTWIWKETKGLGWHHVTSLDLLIEDINGDNLLDIQFVMQDRVMTYMNRDILEVFPLTEEELDKRVDEALKHE